MTRQFLLLSQKALSPQMPLNSGVRCFEEILMAGSALEVLRTSAKLAYDDHVGRLLGLGQPYVESIKPNKGLPLQEILTQYNSDVGKEIVRFGEHLQEEIVAVLGKLEGSVEMPSSKAVLGAIDEFINPDLYPKRFSLFVQAIERKMNSFGVKLELKKHRIDIPESLAQVGALNLCGKIRQRVANSVDRLNLTKPKLESPEASETGTYEKINQAYQSHPVVFWAIGLLLSAVLGVLLL